MGADHPSKPVLPDIDACMRHCSGKSNYFAMAGNGGTCYCKTTITQRRTVAGWFSGTTACANGKLILRNYYAAYFNLILTSQNTSHRKLQVKVYRDAGQIQAQMVTLP